jgi:hypothetical protein
VEAGKLNSSSSLGKNVLLGYAIFFSFLANFQGGGGAIRKFAYKLAFKAVVTGRSVILRIWK